MRYQSAKKEYESIHGMYWYARLVCRFELPIDDPEYENRERENYGNASGGSSGSGSGSGMRFTTMLLPWLFGMFGLASSSSQGGGSGSRGQRDKESN
ncbi:hypothetical protein CQW23_21195 [Capsicum baccatum]|uniref:Uncharacterized protein n=1 Tax=Capsicum baccatum TaxID=33114 RepID=A0A2G2VXB7_CAPBA|nr:hypothetical protein CQW23_21195 [Capsicum baccatum]